MADVALFPAARRGPNPVARPAVAVPTVAGPDEETDRVIDDLLVYYYRIILQEDGVPESMIRMVLDAIPTGRGRSLEGPLSF